MLNIYKGKWRMGADKSKQSGCHYQNIPNIYRHLLPDKISIVYFSDTSFLHQLTKIKSVDTLLQRQPDEPCFNALHNVQKHIEHIQNHPTEPPISLDIFQPRSVASLEHKTWYQLLYVMDNMYFVPMTWVRVFSQLDTNNNDLHSTPFGIPDPSDTILDNLLSLDPSIFRHVFMYNQSINVTPKYSKEGFLHAMCVYRDGLFYILYTPHLFASTFSLHRAMVDHHTKFYHLPSSNKIEEISIILRGFLPKNDLHTILNDN